MGVVVQIWQPLIYGESLSSTQFAVSIELLQNRKYIFSKMFRKGELGSNISWNYLTMTKADKNWELRILKRKEIPRMSPTHSACCPPVGALPVCSRKQTGHPKSRSRVCSTLADLGMQSTEKRAFKAAQSRRAWDTKERVSLRNESENRTCIVFPKLLPGPTST